MRISDCSSDVGSSDLVTLWWMTTTALLPKVLGLLGGYSLTYGGLAGVIIVLLFFSVVGLGLVFGAELNAALAETPEPDLKETAASQENDRKSVVSGKSGSEREDLGGRRRLKKIT